MWGKVRGDAEGLKKCGESAGKCVGVWGERYGGCGEGEMGGVNKCGKRYGRVYGEVCRGVGEVRRKVWGCREDGVSEEVSGGVRECVG